MKLKTDGCSLSFVCFKERQLDYEKKKINKIKGQLVQTVAPLEIGTLWP